MQGFGVFVLVLVALVLILVFMGVKTVPQGRAFTLERFGRYTRTLYPGLNFIFPVIDQIGARMTTQEVVLDIPSQKIITLDNAIVTCDAVAFYQVVNPAQAAYEVQNLTAAIINLVLTNIRSVMGSMSLDEVLSRRTEINDQLLAIIDQATQPWGIKVTRIELKDIAPPEDMVHAMARQMKAEREKRATILEAEGVRESSIKRAEGEKQAAILEAEGRREAAFRDAEARERAAEAEARATTMVSDAIAAGGTGAINYFLGQKYIEALAGIGMAPNNKITFLPLEATGILGAISGIADLTKQGGAGGGSAPKPWGQS
ncbi:SPFH/Band 7/PHB domain protein [Zavarzinia compransoris]|uniref:SPFH domain-containing protein n=1 Tax=Zavarzinia marina TaxID=2911065 RepID=UPI001F33032C|nr:SPFH domain-containing protein [Zavarzinia marina]MCF4164966.1 SPFH/Band 7/PHB domain protein [Zavarzinia marina]